MVNFDLIPAFGGNVFATEARKTRNFYFEMQFYYDDLFREANKEFRVFRASVAKQYLAKRGIEISK